MKNYKRAYVRVTDIDGNVKWVGHWRTLVLTENRDEAHSWAFQKTLNKFAGKAREMYPDTIVDLDYLNVDDATTETETEITEPSTPETTTEETTEPTSIVDKVVIEEFNTDVTEEEDIVPEDVDDLDDLDEFVFED